ncbi:MAG: ROK family protein [Geminicoccaceae bacterium]|nr:ROK family protein [Geminicoccaceae bacterium]
MSEAAPNEAARNEAARNETSLHEAVSPEAGLTGFAVDLGGTKTAAARIEKGVVVDRREVATDGAADLAGQLDGMAALLRALDHRPGSRLGVAVAGRLTAEGIWSALNAGTLTAVQDAPLGRALRQRFGQAGLCNDAAAAALAEARFGAGRGCRIFVYLTVSTGIGGGIVVDGRPFESRRGLAGHLGFLSAPLGRDLCGSGRRGTVESVAGGRAMAAAATAAGHPGANARQVFDAALRGEPWAETIVERSARAVATLCADIAAALDPERIAIGGGIGLASGYLERIEAHLADEPPLFRVPLQPAALGPSGPLLGALAYACGMQEVR